MFVRHLWVSKRSYKQRYFRQEFSGVLLLDAEFLGNSKEAPIGCLKVYSVLLPSRSTFREKFSFFFYEKSFALLPQTCSEFCNLSEAYLCCRNGEIIS